MRFVFLVAACHLWAAFSLWASPKDHSLLPYREYRDTVIRKPLLEAFFADSTVPSGARNLARATLYYRSAQYDSAMRIYGENRSVLPEIEGQVILRMAQCALHLQQYDSARTLLLSETSLLKNRPWWEKADRILIEILLANSQFNTQQRLDSIEQRLLAKPSDSYTRWLQWQKAEQFLLLNQVAKAQSLWIHLLRTPEYRKQALQKLEAHKKNYPYPSSTAERFVIANEYCRKDDHRACLRWADSLLMRPDLSKANRTQLLAAQAKSWQGLSLNDSAALRYRYLLDSIEVRPGWLRSLSRILRLNKQDSAARRLDTLFRQQFPFSPENANRLWVQALESEQDTLWADALLGYSLLLDPRFGDSNKRQWAPFRMGYLWYKQGLYPQAEKAFAEATLSGKAAYPLVASYFFQAESQYKQGLPVKARESFKACIADFPLSWYAHRARARLAELRLLDSAQIPQIRILELNQSAALDWLRNRSARSRHEEKGVDERLQTIETLYRIGFEEEGQSLASQSIKTYGMRPDFLFKLGLIYQRIGDYTESYRMARLFLDKASRRWFSEIPRPIAEFLYPLPTLWRADAERFVRPPVDLALIFAVMRQESIFSPTISSPVGARGLMQFMPQTGRIVAKQEGIAGYHDDLLFNPILSIRLGNRYLGDLLLEYGGDPVYALANYNAGPTPAKRWKANHAHLDLDQRVEEISFWETRDYVKKVLGNYWTYQAIYGAR